MTISTLEPIVEVHGLNKRLGSVQANDNIDLALIPGEIHALLGENGAGKSTLLNLLSGLLQPDSGTITLDGNPVTFPAPAAALDAGIGTVHQHFSLVPNLSITENVVLGGQDGFRLALNKESQTLAPLMADLGLQMPAETEVRFLSIGQQQRVELLKVLSRNSRVLLLDEPTSVLSPQEVDELFEILKSLRKQGTTIVLVTHKLDEAVAISDRVTVLRNGRVAGQIELNKHYNANLTGDIVELMFGERSLPPVSVPISTDPGSVLLTVTDVTALGDRREIALSELSLELRRGEVFGIAGIDGNGQKEMAEILAGQRQVESGSIVMDGQNITNGGPAVARNAGIGYATDDRLGEGTVASLSIADNLVLKQIRQAPFSKRLWLDRTAIQSRARGLVSTYGIRASGPDDRIGTLSGGNVQRVLLARELAAQPSLLICNRPTYGLDVRTARSILQLLRNHAAAGNTVLLISPELEDLFEYSDRIGVIYNGQIVATMPASEADTRSLGRLMTSGTLAAAA